MKRLTTSEARADFSELINKAHYGKEVTMITRRGKDVAAIVPTSMVQPAGPPGRKQPKKSG